MVDTTGTEEAVESPLAVPVRWLQMLQPVVRQPKWLNISVGDDSPQIFLGDRIVKQPVADEVDEQVLVHARLVVAEEVLMFLDKADDIIDPLLWRMEAAPSTGIDDELVARDLSTVTAQTDIGGYFNPSRR